MKGIQSKINRVNRMLSGLAAAIARTLGHAKSQPTDAAAQCGQEYVVRAPTKADCEAAMQRLTNAMHTGGKTEAMRQACEDRVFTDRLSQLMCQQPKSAVVTPVEVVAGDVSLKVVNVETPAGQQMVGPIERELTGRNWEIIAIDDAPSMAEVTKAAPILRDYQLQAIASVIFQQRIEFRPDNVTEHLSVFGLTGQHERRGQGWHRTFIHLPQSGGERMSLGRVMFKDGEFSHIKWYVNSHGAIGPLDYYKVGLDVYRRFGLFIDAPAWSDLVERAKAHAVAKRKAKEEWRRNNPRSGASKRRRALAPPNEVTSLYQVLSDDLSELYGRKVGFFYV